MSAVSVKEAMNQKFIDKSWAGDWVWINPAQKFGAHKVTATSDNQLDTQIIFLTTFNANGPDFGYLDAKDVQGIVYPYSDVVRPFFSPVTPEISKF